jgi:hypothetical protein
MSHGEQVYRDCFQFTPPALTCFTWVCSNCLVCVWRPTLVVVVLGQAFREFLLSRYRPAWSFADRNEIWERKPEAAVRNHQRVLTSH